MENTKVDRGGRITVDGIFVGTLTKDADPTRGYRVVMDSGVKFGAQTRSAAVRRAQVEHVFPMSVR